MFNLGVVPLNMHAMVIEAAVIVMAKVAVAARVDAAAALVQNKHVITLCKWFYLACST